MNFRNCHWSLIFHFLGGFLCFFSALEEEKVQHLPAAPTTLIHTPNHGQFVCLLSYGKEKWKFSMLFTFFFWTSHSHLIWVDLLFAASIGWSLFIFYFIFFFFSFLRCKRTRYRSFLNFFENEKKIQRVYAIQETKMKVIFSWLLLGWLWVASFECKNFGSTTCARQKFAWREASAKWICNLEKKIRKAQKSQNHRISIELIDYFGGKKFSFSLWAHKFFLVLTLSRTRVCNLFSGLSGVRVHRSVVPLCARERFHFLPVCFFLSS